MIRWGLAGILLFVAACSPSRQDLARADYGPFPDNFRRVVIEDWNKDNVDVPPEGFTNWAGPMKGAFRTSSFGTDYFGYEVCVDIERDSPLLGIPLLYTRVYFMIRDGVVTHRRADSTARVQCDAIGT